MSEPAFTETRAVETILALLRPRALPEDQIILAVEATQEAVETAAGNDCWNGLDVPLLLFQLVTANRIAWHDPPGGDGAGTKPLIYSLVKPEAANAPTTP